MFKPLPEDNTPTVSVSIEGRTVTVPAGYTAAAAMLAHGPTATRTTPVTGAPRAPYCMMGVCFECLMEIDGQPNQQGCLVPVREGMTIRTQQGKRVVAS